MLALGGYFSAARAASTPATKDETTARRPGLGARTLRRRITDLTTRLGATRRFQAGAQAGRRGWL
ncbi:hypothetical protein OG568_54725 (plasmid) [Streptomyces sp. NBC_01450]|uniref:hypothetical protein n=1 Tax=Streptomyces sp. NBC_01450 TaxID=2903871 RepID=UPI002E362823|nr:hypothetical protein [Streptomyces sp. NBC_01450]